MPDAIPLCHPFPSAIHKEPTIPLPPGCCTLQYTPQPSGNGYPTVGTDHRPDSRPSRRLRRQAPRPALCAPDRGWSPATAPGLLPQIHKASYGKLSHCPCLSSHNPRPAHKYPPGHRIRQWKSSKPGWPTPSLPNSSQYKRHYGET